MKLNVTSYGRLPTYAKCTRCKGKALVHLPSHHANFCNECFLVFFRNAVKRAMKLFPLRPRDPIMVAVSGGKDSLALWSVLTELGYYTKGLHIDLGIPGFSEASREASKQFARSRNLELSFYSLKDLFGFSLLDIRSRTHRMICSVCGMLKRQFLNRLAIQEGFSIVATGHNLDDEASRLMGNILRHRESYLAKAYPYLPAMPGVASRIKPLFRLESEEIRIYCQIQNISYVKDRCPFSKGATSHIFLESLEFLESKMPGTKRDFLFGYLETKRPPTSDETPGERCSICGAISYRNICGVCRIKEELTKRDGRIVKGKAT
ncbi:MAG: adenine nucleotide alpha hydrolase family protein [Syntrophobacterales bacterium]|nr:adenine nucleotide alpha hydrolase family protein [Syntrophobacterales bacterium]